MPDPDKVYRVVQWATGVVGSSSLRAIIGHPKLQLVGHYVHSPEKDGRDSGELCGLDPVGVRATRSIDEIVALKPDCVLYMQEGTNVEDLCRLLAAGINALAFVPIDHPEIAALLEELLERRLPISRLVTMVQKEVADRMVAEPGTKAYGALSVAVQYYTQPHVELDVPPRSFIPAPEVDSVVIVCDVREEPPVTVADEKLFFRVVRAAFGQRRKTLSNALKGAGFDKELIRTALPAAGIDGTRRGETLSLMEFAAIATAFLKSV